MDIKYLAMKIAEESTEVAQNAIKLALFGEENTGYKNLDLLREEITDLYTVIVMLEKKLGVDLGLAYSKSKAERVKWYYENKVVQ
jgi:NTP pyrophosphatase (non-canonical NTP hydrolase)